MHELSVAMSIIDAVEEEARRHSGRVRAVHVKLGPLSGVIKEALAPAFELACEGTTLAGARLMIEEVPIVVYCQTCRARQPIASMQCFCCPVCDTPAAEVVEGRELELTALEIDDDA